MLLLMDTAPEYWTLAAGLLRPANAPPPQPSGPAVCGPPEAVFDDRDDPDLADAETEILWRVPLRVPLGGETWYRIAPGQPDHKIKLPGPDEELRIAIAASTAAAPDRKPLLDRSLDLWHRIANAGASSAQGGPPHLLVHAGDLIHPDGVTTTHPFLAESFLTGRHAVSPLPDAARRAAKQYYRACYREAWSMAARIGLATQVPSIMVGDDRDIYDGYRGHPQRLEDTKPMAALQEIAREAFAAFQQLSPKQDQATTEDRCLDLGRASLVIPDLRARRTPNHVLGPEGLSAIGKMLASAERSPRSLCLLTVPLIGLEVARLEQTADRLGLSSHLTDHLSDQFSARHHHGERAALLALLGAHLRRAQGPLTLVSAGARMNGLANAQWATPPWAAAPENAADGPVLQQLHLSGMGRRPRPFWQALVTSLLGSRLRSAGGLEWSLQALAKPGERPKGLGPLGIGAFDPKPSALILRLGPAPNHAAQAVWHLEKGGFRALDLPVAQPMTTSPAI
ncbi:MAG: alkaline phosphatase D family protein [Rhodospirillaceae bacterium]